MTWGQKELASPVKQWPERLVKVCEHVMEAERTAFVALTVRNQLV